MGARGHSAARKRRSISRVMYQRALRRSSIASAFRSARHKYFTALPKQKFMCSVIWMHSTPLGCEV